MDSVLMIQYLERLLQLSGMVPPHDKRRGLVKIRIIKI
jgi:hypothetical protein